MPQKLVFGIKPRDAAGVAPRGAFRFRLDPGASSTDIVSIYNYSTAPLDLRLYPTDAFTNRSGSFTTAPAADRAKDVGSWIRLALPQARQFRVTARTRVDVAFRLVVPREASPGDHLGGIVVSLIADSHDAKGNKIKVDNRVSAPVTVRVSGPVHAQLAIDELKASYAGALSPLGRGRIRITYSVRNAGNILLGGHQRLTVEGWFGQSFSPALADLAPLAPGSRTDVSVVLPNTLPAFRYRAAVAVVPTSQVGDPIGERAVATAGIWAVPWSPLVTLLVVALAAWRTRSYLANRVAGRHSGRRAASRRSRRGTSEQVLA